MKVTGVVAEYNPFHKGHEYQLNKARELSGCDAIAVVMSGNFVQRGEPALIDKYKRAESAIYGGADLVIELPMPFSCQNAEVFAKAAVLELKKLPVTYLSFGCENDNIEILKEIAIIQTNNQEYNYTLKQELKSGISYPTAVTNTICKFSNMDFNIKDVMKSPNNVLGLEYIKNSIKMNCAWNFIPIRRIGSNHNDASINGKYASATAIRKTIIENSIHNLSESLTVKSSEMINRFYNEYKNFNTLNNYLNFIYYKILDIGIDGLNDIYEVSEGLNNKIYSNIFKYDNVDDFILSLKSKRYTYSKLRRILLNILLEIKKSNINDYMLLNKDNKFIKVLAFNDIGKQILKEAKNSSTYIINRFSDYKKSNINFNVFNLTNKSTNIYYLPFENKKINEEYIQNAVYVK